MVGGLNDIDKRYIYQLMSNVHLPGSKRFDPQIHIYTITQNNDVSLAKYFKQHLSKENFENGVIDQGRHKNTQQKKMDRQRVSRSG